MNEEKIQKRINYIERILVELGEKSFSTKSSIYIPLKEGKKYGEWKEELKLLKILLSYCK